VESDAVLLTRYAASKDAEAFGELVRRHSGLVYATALRIVRDVHEAEDVAQTCFLELAKKAGAVKRSLPGWLHSLSTSRAIDAARRKGTRQGYERGAAISDGVEPTWGDIDTLVDEALEELPEELRAPIIMRFFQGHSQSEVAQSLGVNQSTISRQLTRGIEALRRELKKAGISASAALLLTLLSEEAAAIESAPLATSLSKIGLAGVDATTKMSGSAKPISVESGVAGMGAWPLPVKLLVGLALALAIAGAITVGLDVLRRPDASSSIPTHVAQPPKLALPAASLRRDDSDGLRFVYDYFELRNDPQLLDELRAIKNSSESRDVRDRQLHSLLSSLVPAFSHVAPVEVGRDYSSTVQKGDETYLVECTVSPFQKTRGLARLGRRLPDPIQRC